MHYNIYFSPTGGTLKVAREISSCFDEVKDIDLSLEIKDQIINNEDTCSIVVPSFGGRIPEIAVKRLRQIKANHTPVIIGVTYGHRDYEDTLLELYDEALNCGFVPKGAMAIISEHSIVRTIATGRPDYNDLLEVNHYVKLVKDRFKYDIYLPIKGNRPYKEIKGGGLKPSTNKKCNECGLCKKMCPVHAINAIYEIDKDLCISCMRCVSICPNHAKVLNPIAYQGVAVLLKKLCDHEIKNEFL